MTFAPHVPIPRAHCPEAAPWGIPQAARWRAARVPGWAVPRLVAWVLAVATAVAIGLLATADSGPVCSEADPCGTTWGGFALAVLMLVVPYWCLRLPGVALVALPLEVAGAILAGVDGGQQTAGERVALVLLIAGPALAWVAVFVRLRARRTQRALALEAAEGLRARLPKGFPPSRRGPVRIAVGALLIAFGGGLLLWGALATADSDAHAERAVRRSAEVTGHVDDFDSRLRVRLTDPAQVRTVPSSFPEDFPVGSTVQILVDGDWARLAAEPYDAVGQQMGSLPFLLPGIGLLSHGIALHRRTRALRTGDQPVLRVVVRVRTDGIRQVFADGGPRTGKPLSVLRCTWVPRESLPLAGLPDRQAGAWAGTGQPASSGVLYGPVHEGSELALLTGLPDGGALIHAATAVVPAG